MASLAAACLLAAAGPASAQDYAEGQSHADYLAWLARSPAARAQALGFKSFLGIKHVEEIVPMWQLFRTASMWRECNGPRFEVAPIVEWNHVAETLAFIERHVVPVIGKVEALSGYRNSELNACAHGAKESAHRHFYALDLTPLRAISREAMIRSICKIYEWRGREYNIGLGFYTGMRFHVDSKGFRRWGADGKSSTSPCAGFA